MFIIWVLYFDDMFVEIKSMVEISRLKAMLATKFDMKDLGEEKQILGIVIHMDKKHGKVWLP